MCSGDTAQLKQTKQTMSFPALGAKFVADKLAGENTRMNDTEKTIRYNQGIQGRIWLGQGLVYDEIYGLLEGLSLLDKPLVKKDGVGSGQTPMAGWFNRLLQTGKSDHETKSNGCHGGSQAPSINISLVGNKHPTPVIGLVKGLRGDHGCQSKARIMCATGTPA